MVSYNGNDWNQDWTNTPVVQQAMNNPAPAPNTDASTGYDSGYQFGNYPGTNQPTWVGSPTTPSSSPTPASDLAHGAGNYPMTSPSGAPLPALYPSPSGVQPAQQAADAASQAYIDAQRAQLGATSPASANLTSAQQAYITAQQAQLAAQPQQQAADQAVLDARGAANSASQAYLAEQTRSNNQQMQEQQGITAAQHNVGDIAAVGAAQRGRDNYAYRYKIAGLNVPIEVTVPAGYTGALPPGVVAKLQTQADILTQNASDADAMEKFYVEAARIASASANTQVEAADIQSGRVKLSLDQLANATSAAQLTVSQADLDLKTATDKSTNGVTAAGLDVSQANLNLKEAGQAPAPGEVWNQYSGQWTSTDQLALDQQTYDQQLQAQKQGVYGGISADAIIGQYVDSNAIGVNTMTEAQLRGALATHPELTPAQIDYYVEIAQTRLAIRQAAGSTGSLPPPPGISTGGTSTTPATTNQTHVVS